MTLVDQPREQLCHCGRYGVFGHGAFPGREPTWYCREHNPDKLVYKPQPIIVRLSERWLARAIEVGKGRQAEALANNRVRYMNRGENPEIFNIVGAIGECATGKHYRLKWTPNPKYDPDEIDVGGCVEVRATSIPGPGTNLGIKPKDRDHLPYVLAWVHLDDYRVELRGWLWGREGKGNPELWHDKSGCWFNRPPYRPLHELWDELPALLAAVKP